MLRTIRLCVLGAGGVGKSCMTVRFVTGAYFESYDPTVEDAYTAERTIDSDRFRLEITDTAGVEQMVSLRESHIRHAHGFVLVFALNNLSTFRDLGPIMEDIARIKEYDRSKPLPMVLAGNKSDLIFERAFPSPFNPSSIPLSARSASSSSPALQSQPAGRSVWDGVPFFETSAKMRVNVEEAFEEAARRVVASGSALGAERWRRRGSTRRKCVIL